MPVTATDRQNIAVIEGYASLFRVRDAAGDIIMPGAFAESLQRRGAGNVRMLFQHEPAEPIGRWLEIKEDSIGLRVRGHLNLGVQRASELAELLKQGTADGLSIGFKTISANRTGQSGERRILKMDLWEISLVTFPMLTGARVMRIS